MVRPKRKSKHHPVSTKITHPKDYTFKNNTKHVLNNVMCVKLEPQRGSLLVVTE